MKTSKNGNGMANKKEKRMTRNNLGLGVKRAMQLVPPAPISLFHSRYVLMEWLILFVAYITAVEIKKFKMRVKEIDF